MSDSLITFLSVEDVCVLHEVTLRRNGGLGGVKNPGLLEAAVAMPRQQFAGAYLHAGVSAMAAAYLFHLCMNHPFNDGNKRVGLLAAYTFAIANGHRMNLKPDLLERLVLDVAAGATGKAELTVVFEREVVPIDPAGS